MYHKSVSATDVWSRSPDLPVTQEGEWVCDHAHSPSVMPGFWIKSRVLDMTLGPLCPHPWLPFQSHLLKCCLFSLPTSARLGHFECISHSLSLSLILSMLFLLSKILFLSHPLPTWLSPDWPGYVG